MKNKHRMISWKGAHKWIGIAFTLPLLAFCVSGIILNHRQAVSGLSVGRSLLPDGYRIRQYSQGVVRGSLACGRGRILVYGSAGVWATDSAVSRFADFNRGLPEGIDGRNVRNLAQTKDGRLWCATQTGLYRSERGRWTPVTLPGCDERLSDLTLSADSSGVVVLTRSFLYLPDGGGFRRKELAAPRDYRPRVSLLRTLWQLHSGALLGRAGRTAVDGVALVLVFLGLSGLVLLALPSSLRRKARESARRWARVLRWNHRWHDRAGYFTLALTLLVALTGMCLRPPLMIPCVMTTTRPLPGTSLDSDNAWHDKLRAIRREAATDTWLIATSEGFFRVGRDFAGAPAPCGAQTPPVSPMGVNVFEAEAPEKWIVGSFSGIYRWNTRTGEVADYLSGRPLAESAGRRPAGANLVAGFTRDFGDKPAVIDYARGTTALPPMPRVLEEQPMSLWNFALELHTGRIYTLLPAPLAALFIFVSGLALTLTLVSGLALHRRHRRHAAKPAK